MTVKNYFSDNRAFTLIELLVVMCILAIMVAIGSLTLKPSLDKTRVRSCGTTMISDIQLIRSHAQSKGGRAIFQLTSVVKAEDIDNDGFPEYYIGFMDADSDGQLDATEEVFIHGTNGDALCSPSVAVERTISKIIFDPLGFVMNGGADRNIYLTGAGIASRIQLVSITGTLRNYLNINDCLEDPTPTPGCDATTDSWEELE